MLKLWVAKKQELKRWADIMSKNKSHDNIKKENEYLRDQLKFYVDNIVNKIPGNVYWMDLDCVLRGCNQSEAETLGLESPNDIVGMTFSDFDKMLPSNKKEHAKIEQINRKVMKSGVSLENIEQEPIVKMNGEKAYYADNRIPVINDKGKIIGLVGISIDITDKKRAEEARVKQALIDNAAQVSHDIRSPLAALNTVLRNLPTMPEDQRILIRNAVQRINDIANNLLLEYRDDTQEDSATKKRVTVKPELLSSLLNSLLSEKKAQRGNRRIELNLEVNEKAFGVFASIEPMQFKRVISNLLNNAIEAIDAAGTVTVHLSKQSDHARISIIDTGKGISSALLAQIKKGGTSHDKEKGTGIGIASAIALVEQQGGHFDMISEVNQGTTVTIDLPLAPAPEWFQERLKLAPCMTVVVLDDDESIHAIWTSRCQPFLSDITLTHIHQSKTFREYCQSADLSNTLFLIDYEILGSEESGLDLIEQLQLSKLSILVTSHYEESKIQTRAKRLGVKIIPKNFSPYIPISLVSGDNLRLVFIDDDKTLTAAWEQEAERQGLSIRTFNRSADLRMTLTTLDKTTPIYIDSNLRESISGEDFAKELYEQGFTELYLASGYPKGHFGDLPWIKEFVGKEPPF